jgi:hypothetical protein
MVYGSEAWTLTKQAVNKINSFERKILQNFLDLPSHKECGETDKTRSYMRCMRIYIAFSAHIQIKRLKWAGHVTRTAFQRRF